MVEQTKIETCIPPMTTSTYGGKWEKTMQQCDQSEELSTQGARKSIPTESTSGGAVPSGKWGIKPHVLLIHLTNYGSRMSQASQTSELYSQQSWCVYLTKRSTFWSRSSRTRCSRVQRPRSFVSAWQMIFAIFFFFFNSRSNQWYL